MTIRKAKIRNKYGIHCRPAAMIAKEAQNFDGQIDIENEQNQSSIAKNIMGLLSLGIGCGQSAMIKVEGENEEHVADQMQELLETEFEFVR